MRQWPVLLAVAMGLGVTGLAFFYVRHSDHERLASRFEREAGNLTLAVRQRTASYLDVLFSLRDYFDAEGTVTRRAFGTFARAQLKRHEGFQALEWVPEVPMSARARFEAEARQDGLKDFRFVERDATGRLLPVAPRPVYHPVYYVEPLEGNEAALGYAPALAPRDQAIATARDTGLPAFTGRFKAVQAAQFSVAVFVPVYRGTTSPTSPESRRSQFRGLVEGFILVEDMLREPIDEARDAGIAVTLTDASDPAGPQTLVSAHPAGHPDTADVDARFRREESINLGNRQWKLSYALTDSRALESFRGLEWWVLLGGLVATGLMGGYLFNVLNQRMRVEQMVIDRTEALRKEKELAQYYLDLAGTIVVMVKPDGAVSLINRQGSEVLGYSQEELIGKNWFDTCVPERERERVRAQFEAVRHEHPQPIFFESPVLTREGEERLIAWHSTGLSDEHGTAVTLSSGADVTDYRRAIEEVAARRAELKQAQELDRLKNTFTSSVSHDLRTPLTSIVGYAEFLEDAIGGELTSEQRTYVTQIIRGARRLEHLVDDLLDFAQIDAGTFRLRRQPVDLAQRIRDVAESLAPQLEEAGLSLTVDVPPEGLVAPMDPARMERVLLNLLHNAVKFTPSGGKLCIRAWEADGKLHGEVEDTGIGIPESQIPRLFQRFSQLKSGSAKGGTGLGLSICQAIVDAHGGTIGVRSEPGRGSVFWFTLPVS